MIKFDMEGIHRSLTKKEMLRIVYFYLLQMNIGSRFGQKVKKTRNMDATMLRVYIKVRHINPPSV